MPGRQIEFAGDLNKFGVPISIILLFLRNKTYNVSVTDYQTRSPTCIKIRTWLTSGGLYDWYALKYAFFKIKNL